MIPGEYRDTLEAAIRHAYKAGLIVDDDYWRSEAVAVYYNRYRGNESYVIVTKQGLFLCVKRCWDNYKKRYEAWASVESDWPDCNCL